MDKTEELRRLREQFELVMSTNLPFQERNALFSDETADLIVLEVATEGLGERQATPRFIDVFRKTDNLGDSYGALERCKSEDWVLKKWQFPFEFFLLADSTTKLAMISHLDKADSGKLKVGENHDVEPAIENGCPDRRPITLAFLWLGLLFVNRPDDREENAWYTEYALCQLQRNRGSNVDYKVADPLRYVHRKNFHQCWANCSTVVK